MFVFGLPGKFSTDGHNAVKDALEEGKLQYFARAVIAFLIKVLSFFHIFRSRPDRRLENVHPSDALSLIPDNNSTTEAAKEDKVTPLIERLEKLESMLNELSRKPAEIPQEKEHAIRESMNRIKSVEFDLHKTNKVGLLYLRRYCVTYSSLNRKLSFKSQLTKPRSLDVCFCNYLDNLLLEIIRHRKCCDSILRSGWMPF